MDILTGILIPFIGTTAGSACVFFLRGELKPGVQKAFLGFASGVMVAASVWSLLIPAMEMSDGLGRLAFLPAVTGFLLGMAFLLFLDMVVPHLHMDTDQPEGAKSNWKKSTMLVLAVTLHNIPEGMAVGVAFAGMLAKSESITLAGAMALSLGIAIQNFPEGAVISLPLKEAAGQKKAFVYGMLSGIVEPIGAGLMLLLAEKLEPFMPYFLSFAAVLIDGDNTSFEKTILCSRCHALRSSGRTGAGSIRRGTFQYWYHRICHWVCIDDGP